MRLHVSDTETKIEFELIPTKAEDVATVNRQGLCNIATVITNL